MASSVKQIWEKRANSPDDSDPLSKAKSLDSSKLMKRKTLDVVSKFEKMAMSEKVATQELAKMSSAYRPFSGDEATSSGPNKENELRSKKSSLREIAKETAMNRGNGQVENTTEKMQIRQQIAEIKKSLNNALAALDDVSTRVDKM